MAEQTRGIDGGRDKQGAARPNRQSVMKQPAVFGGLEITASAIVVPHNHVFDLTISMPPRSFGHVSAIGDLDYWLIAQALPSGDHLARVIPYGVSAMGVKGHT
jgi:hypothetical protein